MENNNDESPYIKLVSAEGSEIFLSRRIALQVETLRVMLEGNFRESEEGVIRFPDISHSALEKVVKYLYYRDRYANSASRIPEFVIDPEEVCVAHCMHVCCIMYDNPNLKHINVHLPVFFTLLPLVIGIVGRC